MIAKLSRKDIKMLESSAKNNVSKSALEEYLSAHKKAETAWKVFRDSLVLSKGSGEDNASKELKGEKIRKFKAGDEVRVLTTEHPLAYTENLNVGSVVTVAGYKGEEIPWNSDTKNTRPVLVGSHSCNSWGHFEESALELVEEKSQNELRAEIIEKAKEFVENAKIKEFTGRVRTGLGLPEEGQTNTYYGVYVFGGKFKNVCDVEFIVNQESAQLSL